MPPDNGMLNKYLQLLREEQAECVALLATPNDRTAFGYGQASGRYIGLKRAEQLLEVALDEEDDRT